MAGASPSPATSRTASSYGRARRRPAPPAPFPVSGSTTSSAGPSAGPGTGGSSSVRSRAAAGPRRRRRPSRWDRSWKRRRARPRRWRPSRTCSARRTTRPSSSTTRGRSSRSSIRPPARRRRSARPASSPTSSPRRTGGSSSSTREAAVLDAGPLLLFRADGRGVGCGGKPVATIADLPVSDEIPRQGEPTGPREVAWQPLVPATVAWVEALDGGDPMRKVPHRERVMTLAAPFTGAPVEITRLKQRFTPRVDGAQGRRARDRVRPRPEVADHVPRRPRRPRRRRRPSSTCRSTTPTRTRASR